VAATRADFKIGDSVTFIVECEAFDQVGMSHPQIGGPSQSSLNCNIVR
jgi:hypothetical protein